MNIIYLDFDGVLHDDEVYWHRKKGIYIKTVDRSLFEWMEILEDLLTPYPNVKLVLSTSWVRVKSFQFARNQLSLTLQKRVVGATFHHRMMSHLIYDNLSRGDQILCDVRRRKPDSWFAIDNDDDGWPLQHREKLIKTQDHLGISCTDIQEKIRQKLMMKI